MPASCQELIKQARDHSPTAEPDANLLLGRYDFHSEMQVGQHLVG